MNAEKLGHDLELVNGVVIVENVEQLWAGIRYSIHASATRVQLGLSHWDWLVKRHIEAVASKHGLKLLTFHYSEIWEGLLTVDGSVSDRGQIKRNLYLEFVLTSDKEWFILSVY